MKQFSITRMELLSRKKQLDLARQGRNLLEQKRTALLEELFRTADSVVQETETLQEIAAQAQRALARAEALAGSEAVRSAALAARSELPIHLETVNVMGVGITVIEQKRLIRPTLGRGYAVVGTSITIDEAAAAFELEIEAIIRVAESELRLMRLASELQQTTRRLNALDHVLIPRLETECSYIEQGLNERERSDHFRLKLAKKKLLT
jgi:V/A-type H+-transporting ATPase subunit D